MSTTITQIQVRRDNSDNWDSANPVLADGEWGFERDSGGVKIGDGSQAWAELPYVNVITVGPQGPPGIQGPQGIQGIQGPIGLSGPAGADGSGGASTGVSQENYFNKNAEQDVDCTGASGVAINAYISKATTTDITLGIVGIGVGVPFQVVWINNTNQVVNCEIRFYETMALGSFNNAYILGEQSSAIPVPAQSTMLIAGVFTDGFNAGMTIYGYAQVET